MKAATSTSQSSNRPPHEAEVTQAELDEIEYLQNNLDPDYSAWADEAWNRHGSSVRGWVLWTFWKSAQGVHNTGGFFARNLLGIDEMKYQLEYESRIAEIEEEEQMKAETELADVKAQEELEGQLHSGPVSSE